MLNPLGMADPALTFSEPDAAGYVEVLKPNGAPAGYIHKAGGSYVADLRVTSMTFRELLAVTLHTATLEDGGGTHTASVMQARWLLAALKVAADSLDNLGKSVAS